MATTTLRRVTLTRPPKVTEETKQLAREALVVLKYDRLAKKVLDGDESLSAVLRRLDIKPFDRRAVAAYQEEQVEAARKRLKNSWPSWRRSALQYADVPLFVLRKAIQIKLAAPKVRLSIEQLTNDPDPFLIARLHGQEFYIDVWDEKDFEKEL